MSWDVDQVEFYETFAAVEAARGIEDAKEWAWSALNWTQQELRRVNALGKDVQQTVINNVEDSMSTTPEMVNHPKHYNLGKFEVIDVIEDWKLDFHLGNTVKYIARAGHKDAALQDLKKARWYLDRRIEQLEKIDKLVLDTVQTMRASK